MADQLEEIKQKIDIIGLISEYLPLKKAGRNFKTNCPFHSEKTPSFIISPERQIWHCFGCQKGGDIFGFLMQMENLEFPEALEILAKKAGVKLIRNFETSQTAKIKEKIYEINHLASEFYHYILLNHASGKPALNYILGRGISKKSLGTFSIGYAPQMWDGLIKFLSKKGYSLADMETAGLAIKATMQQGNKATRYYDRFRGRLMFTLKDQRGNVVGFAGRKIIEDPKDESGKYINSPETPVYVKGNVLYGLDVTKEMIKKEDRVIVVEGELDLISSFQAGVSNIVAIKGSALTEGQVNLLKRYTQNLILALDMDLAGESASKRGIEIADNAGFNITVVKLPMGKDPDECARTDAAAYKKAIEKAMPVFDYILETSLEKFDAKTAEGKKKISEEVLPVLIKITNPIVQAHYTSKLSKVLGVSEEVIISAGEKIAKTQTLGRGKAVEAVVKDSTSNQEKLEEYLLGIFLQSGKTEKDLEQFFSNPAVIKVYNLLCKYLEDKTLDIKEFVKIIPQELVGVVDRAYLFEVEEKELLKTIDFLKRSYYRNHLLALAQEMKKTEDKEKLDKLSKDYQKASLELKKLA